MSSVEVDSVLDQTQVLICKNSLSRNKKRIANVAELNFLIRFKRFRVNYSDFVYVATGLLHHAT